MFLIYKNKCLNLNHVIDLQIVKRAPHFDPQKKTFYSIMCRIVNGGNPEELACFDTKHEADEFLRSLHDRFNEMSKNNCQCTYLNRL